MSADVFSKQKSQCLKGVDLSRKGSIDEPIRDLIQVLNSQDQYFTTSSCSGRIIIVDNETESGIKKKGCKWILTSHDPVTAAAVIENVKSVNSCAVFKFEPFVLHAQCRTLDDAKRLLDCGVASGFRNSGISLGGKGKVITAIRSTHSLEVPLSSEGKLLVSEEYLQYLVILANKKMEENIHRINRLFTNLKSSLSDCTSAEEKKEKKKMGKRNKTDKRSGSENVTNIKCAPVDITDELGNCDLFGTDVT